MTDITMCARNDCPKGHECCRRLATPSGSHQSWTYPEKVYPLCDLYWPRSRDNDERRETRHD